MGKLGDAEELKNQTIALCDGIVREVHTHEGNINLCSNNIPTLVSQFQALSQFPSCTEECESNSTVQCSELRRRKRRSRKWHIPDISKREYPFSYHKCIDFSLKKKKIRGKKLDAHTHETPDRDETPQSAKIPEREGYVQCRFLFLQGIPTSMLAHGVWDFRSKRQWMWCFRSPNAMFCGEVQWG